MSATPETRRMPRVERREQILDAATRAFARAGFSATNLDDVATEAGITRVLLYRHFDSKTDMYRAVLERACTRLKDSAGDDDYDEQSIPALLRAASADPEGFRLLFHHAAREPEFRDLVDTIVDDGVRTALRHIEGLIPDPAWAKWAARMLHTVTIEAVIAWLDEGSPDPDDAAERISLVVHGVLQAARAR
ncbi:TetR/AcrR family transcriptional regulator [Actinokineospora xionganensis]|uniref:TetR family transcriptional regulator n=1 Tax=Actinokineospora xionganensis TaxID=2684470 RepID=A0ABR7LFF0_9PSEU|nr:TetR family transcriptional regulator [Actinokineospora xionganensis]MBC6451223.1 TetR family transcriptional regulator [Actinokineospora xionganensis]